MKSLLMALFVVAIGTLIYGRDVSPEFERAHIRGAKTRIVLKAVDDVGNPVAGASIHVLMGMNYRLKSYDIDGVTDTNGVFVVEGKTTGNEIEITARKDGHYEVFKKLCFISMGNEYEVKNGKWQPWGMEMLLSLRRRLNPVDLIVSGDSFYVPSTNSWIGFDMAKKDWVYEGKTGVKSDFEVFVTWDGKGGPAPLGYLNDYRTKTIIPDPQFASVIRQIYETYSSGHYTLREISFLLKEKGATTRHEKPYSQSKVRWILSNPFYIGLFRYNGELYEGNHKPLIEKVLFDKVQQILKQRSHNQPDKKNPMVYCGLLRCPCGMMVTAEKHIKHFKNGNCPEYIYYRCSRKNKRVNCVEPAIRFELLDKQLGTLLLEYALSDTMLDWLRDRINRDAVESERLQLSARAELQSMITNLERKQSILVDSYLEQDIDRPTFLTKKEWILNEKKTAKDKLVALENSQKCWVEPMNNWLNMLGSICKIVENGDYAKKKELALEIFGLNLFLSNKTLILKGSSGAGGGGENGPL